MKYIPIIILILLTSCENKNEIHVLFENVNGLQVSDPVSIDGLVISNVDDMTLENGQVDVQFKLENEIQLYTDATFTIKGNLLGEKYIDVDPGNSNKALNLTQPIYGQLEPPLIDSASLHDLVDKINDFFKVNKNEFDSLEIK